MKATTVLMCASMAVTCGIINLTQAEPLDTLLRAATFDDNQPHSRVRRNLKEGVHGHHGHHGHHGDHHGDHGDHHGDHSDHHGDHGDHGNHSGSHDHHHHDEDGELGVWRTINQTDSFGCVAKLACMLEHKATDKHISDQEVAVLNYVSKAPAEGSSFYELSALKAPYYFAAYVGYKHGELMCVKFFPDCVHKMDEMANFVNNFDFRNSISN